jgi:hypothetical protein
MSNKGNPENRDAENVETVHEYSAISVWNTPVLTGSLRARIVRRKGKKYLDLREWHKGPDFEGWTKRGLRFSASELRVLEGIIADAKVRLNAEPGTKDTAQWPKASPATDAETEGLVST